MAPPRARRPPTSPASPATDVALHDLLAELGYTGRNEAPSRLELEKVGLTRPGKQRIAVHKRAEVERVLRDRFVLLCGRVGCRDAALTAHQERRQVLHTERPADCAQCGGSGNKQAIDRLCLALHAGGMRRLVVVGGSPSVREELRRLFAARVELRLIDGTERRTRDEARNDLRWADLCVIWGGTELDHKVSTLYTDAGEGHLVTVHRRGVAALGDGVREHLERQSAQRGRPPSR